MIVRCACADGTAAAKSAEAITPDIKKHLRKFADRARGGKPLVTANLESRPTAKWRHAAPRILSLLIRGPSASRKFMFINTDLLHGSRMMSGCRLAIVARFEQPPPSRPVLFAGMPVTSRAVAASVL